MSDKENGYWVYIPTYIWRKFIKLFCCILKEYLCGKLVLSCVRRSYVWETLFIFLVLSTFTIKLNDSILYWRKKNFRKMFNRFFFHFPHFSDTFLSEIWNLCPLYWLYWTLFFYWIFDAKKTGIYRTNHCRIRSLIDSHLSDSKINFIILVKIWNKF